MIIHNNGLFYLANDKLSYLFRVGKYGELQHLHFGAPVKMEDADSLFCRQGLGWGSNIVLDDSDVESCLDFMALEWSGSGRGDYRESPWSWPVSPRICTTLAMRFWKASHI